ncbi:Cof-type HAD-IIB family hydrolase [Listeria cossartiae subsp. cayugensis]|uniref:Cof-type HAD-IIB family hydrolase n=1 Tax=Listeria cossartiae TaxID=2838249 RepID=UPI0028806E29|nr:Cof-type HAD-IIB family hydrolase [Listeria cossartiae]MDT0000966.1 Cof-type HAD-IIB family hydrolase [Listeria cossartiae subsp. cayugensis]MDT0008930.1 Cof-type HAD-IIB family hydrolase [Listeria cossartiae subsp. cayugensis]MDT0030762.1 Cof-type HAD-IIB family hydrolase [Listeria cossartiae subsp. cayugensis]MDT0038877.1 Cof-type HAD-IIB family hydrolase [Listeria cossartiae subsp. cayugensis]MDT0044463.1 Cof-type HAD-IIB family hydrolase [Listeria cossartiae subsp. cayugensis]
MTTQAIILDIDGTLLNDDKKISAKTKEALITAQQNGVKLILASGRPTTGMHLYAEQLEMEKYHGLLVSYNGAKVVDCQTKEELFNQALTVSEGKAVLEHMKNFEVKVMIDKDDYMYVNDVFDCFVPYKGEEINIIQYESRGGNFKLCEKDDLAAFLDYRISKILTAGDPAYMQENYQAMMAPFKDSLNCVFTADFYFEFTAQGIDKAKALDTVLSPLGIHPENIIAFGDGHNDITMVEYAGTGIAMSNAVPELKAAASSVTLSNNEDGIAHVLNSLIPS